jgi:hypothetical protein
MEGLVRALWFRVGMLALLVIAAGRQAAGGAPPVAPDSTEHAAVAVSGLSAYPASWALRPAYPQHSLELAYEFSASEYSEPLVMEQTGTMQGLWLSYRHGSPLRSSVLRALLTNLEASYRRGNVNYDGQLTDGTAYEIDDIPSHVFEARITLGVLRQATPDMELAPYIGFGYRYLRDDSGHDPAGYERETKYYYLPIGMQLTHCVARGWGLVSVAEYDLFLRGRQSTHLSDVDPRFEDFENRQSGGSGARGGLTLWKDTGDVALLFGPFVRYWQVDESGVAAPGGAYARVAEPQNRSLEIGARVGLRAGAGAERR